MWKSNITRLFQFLEILLKGPEVPEDITGTVMVGLEWMGKKLP